MKDDSIYLKHVLNEIAKIDNSFRSITKSDFKNNVDIQDAVIRRVEIIGESAKNISKTLKKKIS